MASADASFELETAGTYSLAASTRFLEGFAPAGQEGGAHGDHLHLAFPADDLERSVGVCLRERGTSVVGEVFGAADASAVAAQVARILSLDHDASGFAAVGERDPVVGRLQARFPGLRPVLFFSPYEAAAWTLIGHRVRIVQAARTKERLAEALGEAVDIHGDVRHAFPTPARLAGLETFQGLFGRKAEWLRALAEAAGEGRLDAERLRSLSSEEAIARLKTLPGIGEFSAELVLLRGAGERDLLPAHEPRLVRAVALAYGLEAPPAREELAELAESWRPYRTWVTVLLRSFLEEETHEIAGGG